MLCPSDVASSVLHLVGTQVPEQEPKCSQWSATRMRWLQGAELSMLSVSWMHLGFLDEMQLYDLAFRVCARLGSLQTLVPEYHNAQQHYMSLVRPRPDPGRCCEGRHLAWEITCRNGVAFSRTVDPQQPTLQACLLH